MRRWLLIPQCKVLTEPEFRPSPLQITWGIALWTLRYRQKKIGKTFGRKSLRKTGEKIALVGAFQCKTGFGSILSIPYYPSCLERRAQLGTGYWLLTGPRNRRERGTGRHPDFALNRSYWNESAITSRCQVEGEGSRYPRHAKQWQGFNYGLVLLSL